MHYATEKELERLDKLAVQHGLAIRQMMELAGWHSIAVLKALHIKKDKKIVVIAGKGNKGGDGLCAARHLINHGYNVTVVLISRKLSPDAKHQCGLLQKMKARIIFFPRVKRKAMQAIATADILVDALIGYHLHGAPRGDFKTVIELMNAVPGRVIAYDIPSGLDSTTGECHEPTIRAAATLTLAYPKKAFRTKAGKAVSGKIYVGDIGIPSWLYDKVRAHSRPNFDDLLLCI